MGVVLFGQDETLRVHQVGPMREALRITAAILDPDCAARVVER